MSRIRIAYLVCLAALAAGLGVELWPALQGRPLDIASILRLIILTSITLALLLNLGRRKT